MSLEQTPPPIDGGAPKSPQSWFNIHPFRRRHLAVVDPEVTTPPVPLEVNSDLAIEVVTQGIILNQAWKRVHSPVSRLRISKTKELLAAFDTVSSDESHIEHKWSAPAHVMDELVTTWKGGVVKSAQNWEPIQIRHAILQTVKNMREQGELYLDLLYERTGLSKQQIESLKEAVPHWEETAKVLREDQRFAAEALSAQLLLKTCREAVIADLQRQGNEKPTNALIAHGIGELLSAHIRVQGNVTAISPGEIEADDRAKEMISELESGRNKIFDKAQLWDEKRSRQKIASVGRSFRKFDSAILQSLTGITPKQVENARKHNRRDLTATASLAGGNELISHAPGVAAIIPQVNIQEYLPNHPWILGAATVTLYGVLAGSLVRNSYLNADLVKSTGVSLDPWSKIKYDQAVDKEKMEAFKASLKYHGVFEGTFVATAAYIGMKYGWEAGLTYFNVANLAGLVKNSVITGGLESFKLVDTAIRKRKNEYDIFLK